MAIADDWDFNYSAKVISHIDGVLTYGTGTGRAPAVGEYIYGATSGAIGKILANDGNTASGNLTLTNVIGVFQDTELLEICSELNFDGVIEAGKTSIVVGAVVDGATGSITVRAIEYNIGGTDGAGTFYGDTFTAFTNDETLDVGGTNIALADGTGTDNDTALGTTVVNDTNGMRVPGTANTNNCVILHYDAGTLAVPEDARISDATSNAEGFAQRVYGSVTTGSIRVVDSDQTGGSWTNNNSLRIEDCVFYDTLVAGSVFAVGDIVNAVNGTSPDAKGRVLAIVDDGDNTGMLILANKSGTWQDDNEIHVQQADDTFVKVAEVENATNKFFDAAVLNLPAGLRDEQRSSDQGGIYDAAIGSLNIVRSFNALYSLAMDNYDELAQLDDDPALEGNVRDQLYTILNDYVIPDLSFRFLEKGSSKDSGNNNIFTNITTTGAIADIGNHGYLYDTSNPTPQPDMYIEQDGAVIRSDWLEGNLDVLVKVKTSTDPVYINPTVNALGQLIDGATVTVHLRPYGRTYDSSEVTQEGGIAVVALGNGVDGNNTTAQYSAVTTGGAGTFVAGEEATTTSGKRVQINAGFTAGGTCTWNNKGATNLINTDAITGVVSGATTTINAVPTDVVAGYDTDIRVMVVQRRFTGGSTTVSTYIPGELITQTGTGATGYFMEDDGGTIYIEEQAASTPFNATGLLTGGTSGALNTPTGTAAFSTVPKDIGGGVGDINYTAVVSADITGASAQTALEVYEWWKFATAREASTYEVNTAGGGYLDFTQGRIYRFLDATFAEVRGASPFGSKAGDLVQGAQGVFIDKDTLDPADIRNIKLIGNDGVTYDPPNLQVLEVTNLAGGERVAVFRSATGGSTVIQRTEFQVGVVGSGNNQAADSTILLAAQDRSVGPLPNDVPDSGVLRILDPNDTGDYLSFIYSSVNRTTNVFTLASGDIQAITGSGIDLTLADNAHVVPIEEQAVGASVNNTLQYVSDINLVVIVRIKGKQPFRTTGTFGTTGASIGAVLNPDNVVNLP